MRFSYVYIKGVILLVQSMTGYGFHSLNKNGIKLTVEIKTVNHRFLDVQVKMSRQFLSLEDAIKKMVSTSIKRGRVDVFISTEGESLTKKEVTVDWPLMDIYVKTLNQLKDNYGIHQELTLDQLKNEEIITISQIPIEQEYINELLLGAVNEAVNEVTVMRKREGQLLKEELLAYINIITTILEEVKTLSKEATTIYFEKLKVKIQELINQSVDQERIVTEAAIFAERTDVTEEITRLSSHIQQFVQALNEEDSIGRKLDFIIQEMNREVNTIGSKCNDAQISKLVVELKSFIEKMKEQVQNIE